MPRRVDRSYDVESSQSPSTPAQPATPQSLRDITSHSSQSLREETFQCATPMTEFDDQVNGYCVDESFHSAHSLDEQMHGIHPMYQYGMPPPQLLCDIRQRNTSLEAINMSSNYHAHAGQALQYRVYSSYSPSGLINTSHGGSISFLPASTYISAVPESDNYRGAHNATHSLHGSSSMRPAPTMAYSHQLAQVQQQMLTRPQQIPYHAMVQYGFPMPMKHKSWCGHE